MEIFLSILLCIALISIMMLGYFDEKKEWNGGKCPKCGKKWEYLGTITTEDMSINVPPVINIFG